MTTTQTLQPIPYLSFDGNCGEAMDFYADVFKGKVTARFTFGSTPMADQFPADFHDKMMNVALELPGGLIMYGGDCPPGMPCSPMAGLMLALNFATVAEAETAFNRLADGGKVTMPFAPTFWVEKFGMVTDKYGVHWGVNGGKMVTQG